MWGFFFEKYNRKGVRLIKEGVTNKEVAELMNLSIRTIEFHRKNIRKKLDIKNRKVNLGTHLLSIH